MPGKKSAKAAPGTASKKTVRRKPAPAKPASGKVSPKAASDRAAVVIGVNRTNGLTPLASAAAGAAQVAAFLEQDGYDVLLLTDAGDKVVRARDIEDAVATFVTPVVRYKKLVVYFSGHGYWQNRSDVWLLSEAPTRTSEAINLAGAIDLARYCGIPHVIFVSDACRSLPADLGGATLNGQFGFPSLPDIATASKVDVFRATARGLAAYEGKIGEEQKSLLTAALLSAYDRAPETIVRTVRENEADVKIVPNRLLEDYLQDTVDDLLADIDFNLVQNIEADVPSGDMTYIARFRGRPAAAARPAATERAPVAASKPGAARRRTAPKADGRLAADLVTATLNRRAPQALESTRPARPRTQSKALEEEIAAAIPTSTVTHFESSKGFVVSGAKVSEVLAMKSPEKVTVDLLQRGVMSGTGLGEAPADVFRVWTSLRAATVAVFLADGRCFLLPALDGYIGHCTVTPAGLTNVSYIPSDRDWRWDEYARNRTRLDQLRAKVAVAANHGRFSLSSGDDAQRFADEVRVGKAIDPTLGLYAAYAYSQAGDEKNVQEVLDHMRLDIGVDLFDVRMLAFRTPPTGGPPLAPPFPLLTQGWNLVGPRQVKLPRLFEDGHAHLAESLWTTFQPAFTKILLEAFKTGEI